MAAIRLVTDTFLWPLTVGSALFWNCRIFSTPSCSSAQRGTQKIFFYPTGQNAYDAMVVAIDIGRFTGIGRLQMQSFYTGHFFSFFADFNAIASNFGLSSD
jgi:hypothetical protein